MQYFQDCEEWWEVPGLWVHPDTASFARLYKCRPTEDQARKDKDELNTVLVYSILMVKMLINMIVMCQPSGPRDMQYGNDN